MARTALPAEFNIGVAVLHSDGSVSVVNGPRLKNGTATLEFAIGVLEVRGDRVVWRPTTGAEEVFEFVGGQWFPGGPLESEPIASRQAPTSTQAIPVHPLLNRFKHWPKPQHGLGLIVASLVVAWFVWDVAFRGTRGDLRSESVARSERIVKDGDGDDAAQQHEVSGKNGPQQAPSTRVDEQQPEGLRQIAETLETAVELRNANEWKRVPKLLERSALWLQHAEGEVRWWREAAQLFRKQEAQLRELGRKQGVAEKDFDSHLERLIKFGGNDQPSRDESDVEPGQEGESEFERDWFPTEPSTDPLELVGQIHRYGLTARRVTKEQVRKLRDVLVVCQEVLGGCAQQERAYEELAALIPVESLTREGHDGRVLLPDGKRLGRPQRKPESFDEPPPPPPLVTESRLLPPEGEVVGLTKQVGKQDWMLPDGRRPPLSLEYRALENLNLETAEFVKYASVLFELHPRADRKVYEAKLQQYGGISKLGPRRWYGAEVIPTEGLFAHTFGQPTDNRDSQLLIAGEVRADESGEYWWLVGEQGSVTLGRPDLQQALTWSDMKLRASRWREAGKPKERFRDHEMKRFLEKFVEWHLAALMSRAEVVRKREAIPLDDDVRQLGAWLD